MKELVKAKNLIVIMLAIIIIILLIFVIILLADMQSEESPSPPVTSGLDNGSVSNDERQDSSSLKPEETESASTSKKSEYEKKYKYYQGLDRYTGTQTSYNNKISSLNQALSQTYIDYQKKINEVNSSNLGDGYKESLKKQYENERDQKFKEISAEIADTKAAWENQQNYLKYYNLYLNEDD